MDPRSEELRGSISVCVDKAHKSLSDRNDYSGPVSPRVANSRNAPVGTSGDRVDSTEKEIGNRPNIDRIERGQLFNNLIRPSWFNFNSSWAGMQPGRTDCLRDVHVQIDHSYQR